MADNRVAEFAISIHAPARGATETMLHKVGDDDISIHAPARGATRTGTAAFFKPFDFNPRTREGCDSIRGGAG